MSTGNAVQHVLIRRDLTAVQIKIGAYLVGIANGHRECWSKVEDIMLDCNVSNRTVSTATMRFCELGMMTISKVGTRNHYHIADWLYDTPAVLPSRSNMKSVSQTNDATVWWRVKPDAPDNVQPVSHNAPDIVQPSSRNDDISNVKPATCTKDSVGVSSLRSETQKKDSRSKCTQLHASFEAFWKRYPRKVGKKAAAKAFAKAVKQGADPQTIIAGIERYRLPDEDRFIPHPTTWLNAGRWEDEQPPQPKRANGHATPGGTWL